MIRGNTYYNHGRQILLVDPDETSAYLIKEILSIHGIRVIHAKNGREAIKLFLENPFVECLITEIGVPYRNGFEILKALRRLNPSLPAIVQTAFAYGNIVNICLDAGFNDIVFKPINIRTFARLVQLYTMPSLVMN